MVHLSGERNEDEGAEKLAALIAFRVNQELLLSSESCCEAKLRVEKYAYKG